MSRASDIWNSMSYVQRMLLVGSSLERQILDYKLELGRARRAHRIQIKDIKDHLKNVERAYDEWERKVGDLKEFPRDQVKETENE